MKLFFKEIFKGGMPEYCLNDIDRKDRDVVNNYISQITHVNQEVNVSDMLIKDNEHKTTESNTKDIYYKNNNCYIKYDKLKINTYDYDNYEMEPYQRLVCDGYYIVVYQSDFYPNYEKSKTNPIYVYETIDGYIENLKLSADLTKTLKKVLLIKKIIEWINFIPPFKLYKDFNTTVKNKLHKMIADKEIYEYELKVNPAYPQLYKFQNDKCYGILNISI